MEFYHAVAFRIQNLCLQKHVKPYEWAKIADVSPSAMKNLLNGTDQDMDTNMLKQLCSGINITLGEFFADDLFDRKKKTEETE